MHDYTFFYWFKYLNLADLNYYPFMAILDESSGPYNSANDVSKKYVFQVKQKMWMLKHLM